MCYTCFMQVISVQEMLRQMKETIARNRYRTFSIGYLTADASRDKGGEFRKIDRVRLHHLKGKSGHLNDRSLRLELETGDIITVHMDTILFFNNIPVA